MAEKNISLFIMGNMLAYLPFPENCIIVLGKINFYTRCNLICVSMQAPEEIQPFFKLYVWYWNFKFYKLSGIIYLVWVFMVNDDHLQDISFTAMSVVHYNTNSIYLHQNWKLLNINLQIIKNMVCNLAIFLSWCVHRTTEVLTIHKVFSYCIKYSFF